VEALAPAVAEAEVLGASTRYWTYGPESAPVLLAVHGFRGDHHGLEPFVPWLPGRRIVIPDLPGFGRSAVLPGRLHDMDAFAQWLAAFQQAVLPGAFDLLGHSFGSIVCAAAVAQGLAPRRLVLVNPIAAPALSGPSGFGTWLAVLYYRAAAALPERAGRGLLANRAIVRGMSEVMAKTRDRRLRAWIHDQHRRYFSDFASRTSLLEAFRASTANDVSQFAPRIAAPTLLIGGDRDDITTVPAQERLATLFPQARLEIIAGVGHLVHYERPREAAELVEAFLSAP